MSIEEIAEYHFSFAIISRRPGLALMSHQLEYPHGVPSDQRHCRLQSSYCPPSHAAVVVKEVRNLFNLSSVTEARSPL